ncbi:MAG: asparaginase [Acidobacteria bacterium]|nr:MAG: asparaginase [Acidobacteriota bacterium]REJ99169.1 MAG: asparaginase [Acidobacteriota bacterium]REK16110.1 MAG: asparaginase [Acidobacteriota bacterium]REK43791.1 MAG: asparaginase [Acidobacteriota bacterium]
MNISPIIARAIRGETTESVHRGHIVVLRNGDPIAALGDPSTVTFSRSSIKAFQAIPFLASGAADDLGFTDEEIALACASHSGEPFHVEAAGSMLRKAGLREEDLGCGPHPPFHEESAADLIRAGKKPRRIHNNCSGKHAAMLAHASHIGADTSKYLDPSSPVQKEIKKTISLFSGVPESEIAMGIDGCSAPNFALPLSSLAYAYANLIDPPDSFGEAVATAANKIVGAAMKHPEYVGGSYRLDTKVMRALPGRIVCKVGAEGVWLAGIPETQGGSIAIALKIEDGNDDRARPAVAVELLRKLGLMTEEAEEAIGEFSPMALKDRNDSVVGKVEPVLEGLKL